MELWSCFQLQPQLVRVTRKSGVQNTRNEEVRMVSIRTLATPSRLARPNTPGSNSS